MKHKKIPNKSIEQTTQVTYKYYAKRNKLIGIVLAIVIAASIGAYDHRWDIYMIPVPDMHDFPINTTGYTIEPLPFSFSVSFVRGDDVYFVDGTGRVFKADDSDLTHTRTINWSFPYPSQDAFC